MAIYNKFKKYRKYVSSDGVNYTPSDEYNYVTIPDPSVRDKCDCGYTEEKTFLQHEFEYKDFYTRLWIGPTADYYWNNYFEKTHIAFENDDYLDVEGRVKVVHVTANTCPLNTDYIDDEVVKRGFDEITVKLKYAPEDEIAINLNHQDGTPIKIYNYLYIYRKHKVYFKRPQVDEWIDTGLYIWIKTDDYTTEDLDDYLYRNSIPEEDQIVSFYNSDDRAVIYRKIFVRSGDNTLTYWHQWFTELTSTKKVFTPMYVKYDFKLDIDLTNDTEFKLNFAKLGDVYLNENKDLYVGVGNLPALTNEGRSVNSETNNTGISLAAVRPEMYDTDVYLVYKNKYIVKSKRDTNRPSDIDYNIFTAGNFYFSATSQYTYAAHSEYEATGTPQDFEPQKIEISGYGFNIRQIKQGDKVVFDGVIMITDGEYKVDTPYYHHVVPTDKSRYVFLNTLTNKVYVNNVNEPICVK